MVHDFLPVEHCSGLDKIRLFSTPQQHPVSVLRIAGAACLISGVVLTRA
ncbi:hypothetical protein [Burkholderia territorii]|nr:hypothetical protein [Burkholderia territorii]